MVSKQPIIGISMFNGYIEDRPHHAIAANYIAAIRQSGAIPWLIAPAEPNIEAITARIDGLLLTGGSDISPDLYADFQHAEVVDVDVARDTTEIELFKSIYKQNKPILGVCRGMQLLNIALGGTLDQHLFDKYADDVGHRAKQKLQNTHQVTIKPDTLLHSIYNASEVEVVSWHHQSVDRLGGGVIVSAAAHDGVIEAIEIPGRSEFCVGVQWHPEVILSQPWQHEVLFASFVAACS
jgi:putative glutamine amidotransferase